MRQNKRYLTYKVFIVAINGIESSRGHLDDVATNFKVLKLLSATSNLKALKKDSYNERSKHLMHHNALRKREIERERE